MTRAILIAMFLTAGRLSAEEPGCPESDTPRQCLRRFLPGFAPAVEADVAASNTGAASSRVPSTVKDFLSIAAAHAGASLLDERRESLTAAWNLPASLFRGRWQMQLETEVSDDRDVRPSLAFGPVTRRLGRSLAPHREAFESMLLARLSPQAGEELGGIAWTSFDVPFRDIVEDAAVRGEVIDMFELAARSPLPDDAARLASAFAALLSDQPQLYVSASFLDNAEGPRVGQASVTWELGARSLNGFFAGDGRRCGQGRDCADALERYARRIGGARARGRLAGTLAYKRILASVADSYVTPEVAGFVSTLVYGRALPSLLREREGRIDLALAYDGTELADPDAASLTLTSTPRSGPQSVPPSFDRFVASATYTQQLSHAWLLPLSVSWSERSESAPGACRTPRVSPPVEFCEPPVTTTRGTWVVHVGFTYKVPRRVPERRWTRGCFCPDD